MTWKDLCGRAAALPEIEESVSYGTPALKVRGKLLARLKEDGETVAIRVGIDERDALMQTDPDSFFLTDHYRAYPMVLVRLACVEPDRLEALLVDAWCDRAPKRVVQSFLAAP